MSIPTYNSLYLPFLECIKDGNIHTHSEIVDFCVRYFQLSEEEADKCLPSGRNYMKDRTSWASTYLKKAGLVISCGKGKYQITDIGVQAMNCGETIDNQYLMRFPDFVAFINKGIKKNDNNCTENPDTRVMPDTDEKSPLEQIDEAIIELNLSLADDIMDEVMNLTCWQFEKFVIKLLVAMGYGSMLDNEDSATKKTGDGGIDGILRADKFGFDSIYIQAKQWKKDSPVGSPEIQKFAGAMSLHGAQKGLFITTSHFSKEAVRTSQTNPACKMVLIDGEALANLMIEYDIGVSTTKIFKVKRVDTDFFTDLD